MTITIYEQDAFQRAEIQLLDLAWKLIQKENIKIHSLPESRGIARLINLLHWEADHTQELVDGDSIFADQVIHLGIHRALDIQIGSSPYAMLAAECMASCSDLYLLGKLSLVGEETDFLMDTLDSFGSYYTQYADESTMEDLLRQVQSDPYQTMIQAAKWIYDFCAQLLYPQDALATADRLLPLEAHLFYPLIHHYNTTNWILTIRSKHPKPQTREDLSQWWASLYGSEKVLQDMFLQEI